MLRLTVSFLALFCLFPCARAQSDDVPATVATCSSEVKTITPGTAFTIAIQLAHPAGWHSYYQNSGGVEQSLASNGTCPKGFPPGPSNGQSQK